MHRNVLLLALIGVVTTGAPAAPAPVARPGGEPAAGITVAQVRRLRQQAAARRRPLVVHGDGRPMDPRDDVLEKNEAPLIFPSLPGTRTSALTYSLMHQFNVARLYRSKVAQEWPVGYVRKLYGDGPDGLERYIDFCRAHGYEAWYAMRANDTHDAGNDAHGRMRLDSCDFKKQHPELMHGTRENPPPFGRWSGLDFAQPLVREQVFRVFQEVCRNYEIDGMQLDFFRHLNMFKSVAWGGTATDAEAAGFTDLMRRLRTMMDEEGARRGRPILFSVRTPDSAEYCRALGLDVATWMKEGLIDAWVVGGYFQLQDWAESVRLGHRYGCQVWASLDESRLPLRGRTVQSAPDWRAAGVNCTEGYRGRALNAWRAGVDSIILFNFFFLPSDPQFGLLKEMDDPARLAGRDLLYVPDPLGPGGGMGPGGWLKGGERFFTRPVFKAGPLAADRPTVAHILVGNDVASASPKGRRRRVTLEVLARGLAGPANLEVRLNGAVLRPTGGAVPLTYLVDPARVKQGENLVTLSLRGQPSGQPFLEDVGLWIRGNGAARGR